MFKIKFTIFRTSQWPILLTNFIGCHNSLNSPWKYKKNSKNPCCKREKLSQEKFNVLPLALAKVNQMGLMVHSGDKILFNFGFESFFIKKCVQNRPHTTDLYILYLRWCFLVPSSHFHPWFSIFRNRRKIKKISRNLVIDNCNNLKIFPINCSSMLPILISHLISKDKTDKRCQ